MPAPHWPSTPASPACTRSRCRRCRQAWRLRRSLSLSANPRPGVSTTLNRFRHCQRRSDMQPADVIGRNVIIKAVPCHRRPLAVGRFGRQRRLGRIADHGRMRGVGDAARRQHRRTHQRVHERGLAAVELADNDDARAAVPVGAGVCGTAVRPIANAPSNAACDSGSVAVVRAFAHCSNSLASPGEASSVSSTPLSSSSAAA